MRRVPPCGGAGAPSGRGGGGMPPHLPPFALAVVAAAALLGLAAADDDGAGWGDANIVLIDAAGGGTKWKVRTEPEGAPRPHPPFDLRWKSNDSSIVVLIASLREDRLVTTLHSMFTNAAHPGRVYAGVVQQNAPGDPDALAQLCEKVGAPLVREAADQEAEAYRGEGVQLRGEERRLFSNPNGCPYYDRVRMLRLPASEARGPAWARGRQIQLVRDSDDFCMQIDAHTIFISNWDVRMATEWGMAANEFAVLTTYPTNAHHLYENTNNHWEVPHLCGASFEGMGRVRNAQARAAANLERPILAPLWAAGLSFARCHAERDVPTDPHLGSLFMGEEFARGVRLWTNGYDFYSITKPVIGTYYGAEKGGRGGMRFDHHESQRTSQRLATLLEWRGADLSDRARAALGRYRPGVRRGLRQYYDWCGVDPQAQRITRNCIVQWVPWELDDAARELQRAAAQWAAQPPRQARLPAAVTTRPADATAAPTEAATQQPAPSAAGGHEAAEGGGEAAGQGRSPPPGGTDTDAPVRPPPLPRLARRAHAAEAAERPGAGRRGAAAVAEHDASRPLVISLCITAAVLALAIVPMLRTRRRAQPLHPFAQRSAALVAMPR
eukprot:TRINITY_DN17276_c0_g1_i1.p1 TRINITY_DN17276_c0_g1~~TRINITY_DN17276_c0_g1_i1.p1  ORF type:complete len:610 (+),score=139.31 TRINITY_DN17276_c0_g1_i1:54-1883(+)